MMATRGPLARVVEIPGVGHAPMLLAQDQVAIVVEFLRSTV
jgi:pimeloyl-ACP methyl ester carboxylesterase